ncbi:uncharacterized protein [Montipora foliosa]|uniref:uncharacterized protein n=1 Tax=Montipora foliosa TaxID=591990 RepID=UPI0035F1B989
MVVKNALIQLPMKDVQLQTEEKWLLFNVPHFQVSRDTNSKGIPEDTRSKTRFDDQGTEPYKPDDLVYESQSNAYELLQRDGKSENWEQPEYQALTKREDTGGLSIGELYSNPSMYQDLKHNVKTSGTDSPVYHALVKQQQHTTEDYPEYECGYLVLLGEHDNINH